MTQERLKQEQKPAKPAGLSEIISSFLSWMNSWPNIGMHQASEKSKTDLGLPAAPLSTSGLPGLGALDGLSFGLGKPARFAPRIPAGPLFFRSDDGFTQELLDAMSKPATPPQEKTMERPTAAIQRCRFSTFTDPKEVALYLLDVEKQLHQRTLERDLAEAAAKEWASKLHIREAEHQLFNDLKQVLPDGQAVDMEQVAELLVQKGYRKE